jgi:serine/threonine protein kinase
MGSFSFIYCNVCGAANQAQATLYFACGHPLETAVEDTAPPSLAGPPVSRPLLAGRYRIIALVGEGGFGAVYKAVDMQRDEALVALKQINLSGLRPRDVIEATETFNREVGMLSGLKHPNLPRIYKYFTDAEHWYLAMDFIEGKTLEEYLTSAKGGHLPVEEVLEIGIQLCNVLEYLHTQQPPIIFRDVKPANVMRATTGLLYLIDFGIARRFTPGQRRDTTVLGSPGYAPPEQYGTAQTTAQSDIYSLGATLRCLLTGKDPSVPASGSAPLYAQELEVPAELDQLLVRMLELDADKRPASMEVVKQALQQMQVEQMSLLPSVPPVRQPLQHAGSARQQQPFTFGPAGQVLQPPSKHGISRRTVIIGLVGVAAVGGVIARSVFSQGFQAPQAPQALPATPPPTPYIDPYRLYTYRGYSGPVYAVAWSPDDKRIASASFDGTAQVWNAFTGGNIFTYKGHSDVVKAVAWSPDGRRIVSGSSDYTAQVWDASTGRNVLTYRGHFDVVEAVAWSPDGKRVASASDDKTVQVWNAP